MKREYKDQSLIAFEKSKEIGLEPNLNFKTVVNGIFSQNMLGLCQHEIRPFLIQRFGSSSWALQCLNVAPQVFAILKHLNIDCELVFGEVKVSGKPQFSASLQGLLNELDSPEKKEFAVHVWIQVGKDYIIDPTIASQLHRHCSSHIDPTQIFVGKAKKLGRDAKLEYQPMLMGEKFLDLTCERS
ncbi:hypothetical protein [Vibrio diabolicus]|uniref:hypothetical protein n=1 Tax=Vibrio diabolicus TaxID=50719 RepID=UPI0040697C41